MLTLYLPVFFCHSLLLILISVTNTKPAMKKIILLFTLCFSITSIQAQYKPVVFDYNKSLFDEGNPLPAETFFMLQGEVPADVNLVSASLLSKDGDQLLYKGVWKRAAGDNGNTFQIPVSHRLRSNDEYSFRINYFKEVDQQSGNQFREQLHGYLDAYIDQTVQIEKNRIRLNEPVSRIMDNLDEIVNRSSAYYDNKSNINFAGFSDLVKKSLQNIRNTPLSEGKFNLFKRKDDSNRDVKIKFAQEQINELKELVKSEVNTLANTDLLTVYDSKYISNYATEKVNKPLTVNVGYGATYLDGDINNLSYDSAPYVGIAFPLGNRAFTSKIISRTTLSAGVFLSNFRNAADQRITGPVIGLPVYAALGYPIFEFVRLNAGATLLQNAAAAPDGFNFQQVSVRPFVGLSADINLWIGLGKNRRMK
jgi:hypothetical protein